MKCRSDPNCAIARTIAMIGGWWSLLILHEAFMGRRRFTDFEQRLGISKNALTERLDALVAGGVFERRPVAEDAKRLEYVLTPMGEALLPVMVALRQWSEDWLFPGEHVPNQLVDSADGSGLARLEVRSTAGRKLTRQDIGLVTAEAPPPPATGLPE